MQTFLLAAAVSFLAQDPFTAAPDHYHLIFENAWAGTTRVTREPHAEYAPVELRTETMDGPLRDVRLHPVHVAGGGIEMQFENGEVRISRVRCDSSLPWGETRPVS